MKKNLIHIENADVSYSGKKVLRGISWDLNSGEHWAVIGENGAGKSTFLKLLRGDIWPDPKDDTIRRYHFDDGPQETPLGIKKLIGTVTPELQDRYAQQGWDLSGLEVVCSGFSDSVWLSGDFSPEQMSHAHSIMQRLRIDSLSERSFPEMSQGEQRKVLIARAVVSSPRVLILDEICSGLDVSARKKVLGLLDEIARGGTSIVSASHRAEELIPSISRMLVLRHGRIIQSGARGDLQDTLQPGGRTIISTRLCRGTRKTTIECRKRYLVQIRNASVYLGGRKVLDNIIWQMNNDENWAIMGPNGSGKSTLLRLMTGELLPALGGEVRWFRGEEFLNTWEVRERIGVVSPQLQAEYTDEMTGEDVVLSGHFSSIGLYAKATRTQRKTAAAVMDSFGIGNLRKKWVNRVSYGEMRKILLARALVKNPDLLILDEPCSGLDAPSRNDFLHFLERTAHGKTRVILVTHHEDELIPSITHLLELDKGRIVSRRRRGRR